MKIAYFVNQYPKVSHSFIRREIVALETLGFQIERFALRGWDGELADQEDLAERGRTRYVLGHGLLPVILAFLRESTLHPLAMLHGLRWTARLARYSDRSSLRHVVTLAEAAWLKVRLISLGISHVHAHFGTNSAEVVMLCHVLGGPGYSFTVHGPEEFDKPVALHLREKIEHSRFVVAISSFGRSQLYRWVDRAHWPKIKVVHCGLERAFHEVAPVPVAAERRLVCVGRLCEQKGQLLLIEAAHLLSERGHQFELVLAGDGEMRPAIEAEIARYALGDKVLITGWVSSDQVRAELLAARAMVLPSFAEGLPVVIMEAMALRRPVLTTYVAGIPELVQPGENGWLFPAGDVDALAAVMADCLALPGDALQAMGETAYRRVLERHDIDTEAAKLAMLFRGMIEC
jgi:colanic acid/amylovoran biosynthesis glycosyltransferase